MSAAILLVDTDLGFLFWLGSALDAAGYEAFPARSVPDAIALLADLHLTVELIIINFALAGAANFVRAMRQASRRLKIVSLSDPESSDLEFGPDAVFAKPAGVTQQATADLVQIVRTTLASDASPLSRAVV